MTKDTILRGLFSSRYRGNSFDYLLDSDRYLFAADKPRYRFCVIGTGLIGREHMRTTLLEGRATIHGIYDASQHSMACAVDAYRQQAPDDDLVVYDSLERACNDPEADALIICTPNYTHIELVREAVKSGKHILLEKPMATTIQDAYEIAQLASHYPAVFQIGLQYRYKAGYAEAIHEALERKSIGDIKTISILEHRVPFLDKVGQWNKFSRYSGGTLVEKCCHYFDLMNLFAQSKPVRVFATGSMAVNFLDFEYDNEHSDIIDNAFVTVDYANGVRASFNLCMFSPTFYEELILCGDEGRLKASEGANFLSEPVRPHLEIMRGDHGPSRTATPGYPTYIEQSGHHGSTFYEHVHFVDRIEGVETSAATVEEGLWSIIVGVAAERSIAAGSPIGVAELLAEHGIEL